MNPSLSPTPAQSSRVWRWLLIGIGLCLVPILGLGLVVISCLTLNSDAAVLRKHVMAATDGGWNTKVQLSVGRSVIDLLRLGLGLVRHRDQNLQEARQALAAVRNASVGVYERSRPLAEWSPATLFADTDKAMGKRGLTRLVGVADHGQTVLIYVPRELENADTVNLCVAVVDHKELVVLSTTIDPAALAALVALHAGTDLKAQLHLAQLQL